MTPAWLVAALLALPVYKADRSADRAEAAAAQKLEITAAIAEAVDRERKWPGSKQELAGMLIAIGYHESGFSLDVGAGRCGPHSCDRDRHGNVRAAGFWQLHVSATSSVEAWEQAKTDIRVAAREAARAITRARWLCRSLEGSLPWQQLVVSAYAGRGCRGSFRGAELRLATYRRVMGAR